MPCIALLTIKEGKSEAEVLGLLHQRVEMAKGIAKAGAVSVPPEVRSQTGAVQKTPRLFRVQGGRIKEERRQRVKGRRLVRHPRTGQRGQVQKE